MTPSFHHNGSKNDLKSPVRKNPANKDTFLQETVHQYLTAQKSLSLEKTTAGGRSFPKTAV